MLDDVFRKTIFDQRKSLIGWVVATVFISGLVIAVWPLVRDTPEFADLVESYPEALLAMFGIEDAAQYLTPSGFIGAQLYSFYVPLIVLVFGIGMGVRAIAGEETDGTLDLLLAHPVSRDRILLEKLAALSLLLAGIGAVLAVSVWLAAQVFDADPGADGIAAASLSGVLLGLVFGTMALAAGAVTGRRVFSLSLVSGIAVLSYLVFGLAGVLGYEWMEKLSPFWYYQGSQPVANGFDLLHLGVLAALAVVFVPVALWGFRRRDVGV